MVWLAAGAIVGASLFKANADKTKAEAEAAEARFNAEMAELAAKDALVRGQHEAAVIRTKASLAIGQQRAAYAGSGVDVDSGTPLDIQAQSAAIGEEEAQIANNNGAREAWGFRQQARNFRNQAALAEAAGESAMWGDLLGGGRNIGGLF